MRILFIGSVDFSHSALQLLIKLNANIVGVCTLKEPLISSDHSDLGELSEANDIPCHYPKNINSKETVNWIESKTPDVIFCFGWSRLLEPELLHLTSLGVIGYHPTALPMNRGRHPIIWSLVLGLKEIGSSFFFMDEGADTGDILSQVEISIYDSDDAATLYSRVTNTALSQIKDFLPLLINKSFKRTPQNHSQGNNWRKRVKPDGEIDWRMSAGSICNLVRALSKPYIGAHCLIDGQELKVWKAAVYVGASVNIEPGKVFMILDEKPVIKCGDEAIHLLLVEPKIVLKEGGYL